MLVKRHHNERNKAPWLLGEVTYMVQYIVYSLLFEVVYSLSTHSFITNLRRYVGCRGNVRMIRSDNGSNHVGASTELTHAFQEMDYIKISNF